MDSKGIKLSQVSKGRIDNIISHLEHYVPKDPRPFVVKLSLMHGIENYSITSELPSELSSGAWDMGSIINGNDYLLAIAHRFDYIPVKPFHDLALIFANCLQRQFCR